jgi:hypothetical protein
MKKAHIAVLGFAIAAFGTIPVARANDPGTKPSREEAHEETHGEPEDENQGTSGKYLGGGAGMPGMGGGMGGIGTLGVGGIGKPSSLLSMRCREGLQGIENHIRKKWNLNSMGLPTWWDKDKAEHLKAKQRIARALEKEHRITVAHDQGLPEIDFDLVEAGVQGAPANVKVRLLIVTVSTVRTDKTEKSAIKVVFPVIPAIGAKDDRGNTIYLPTSASHVLAHNVSCTGPDAQVSANDLLQQGVPQEMIDQEARRPFGDRDAARPDEQVDDIRKVLPRKKSFSGGNALGPSEL